MKRPINVYVVLRLCLGGLFILSGGEKLLSPYQNFLYVIQNYSLLPGWAEMLTARVLPWVEVLAGLFFFLGLWTSKALITLIALVVSFLTVVTQAVIRHLPIDECGCFGQLISFPLKTVLIIDSCILFLLIMLRVRMGQTGRFTLDRYLEKS